VYRVAARSVAGSGRSAAPRDTVFSAPMRNAVLGLVAAVAVALVAADARIFGIEAWKIVLGLMGLAIFRSAGRDPKS
jgi:hypothetical protein